MFVTHSCHCYSHRSVSLKSLSASGVSESPEDPPLCPLHTVHLVVSLLSRVSVNILFLGPGPPPDRPPLSSVPTPNQSRTPTLSWIPLLRTVGTGLSRFEGSTGDLHQSRLCPSRVVYKVVFVRVKLWKEKVSLLFRNYTGHDGVPLSGTVSLPGLGYSEGGPSRGETAIPPRYRPQLKLVGDTNQ